MKNLKLETGSGQFKHLNVLGIVGSGASVGEWEEYSLVSDGPYRHDGLKGLFLC